MRALPKSTIKKAILGLVLLSLFAITPRSLAVDLLSPLIGTVDAAPDSASPSPEPSSTASPSAPAAPEPTASPAVKISQPPKALVTTTADSATAPVPPPPPKATTSQSMRVAVPVSISVDPRAHSVFLPFIHISGAETILICGYTNATSVNFSATGTGVESAGNGTSTFRISGPANLVTAAFNGDMGARLISNTKAVSGSVLSFSFVSLDKPSTDAALCNAGSPSNTRTISFRALNVDLNMVKDGVRLK